ncbi:hypothetical protein INT47_002604 [Mucor saturninus]|uniref:Ubiquitin-like modifier-activating enzyme ATG7 n=1 Tax=Mucor saturninus TaxID=64648 RepID=A0A8H7V2P5_9FUNG|nr:hypothetical protein INT47_002604 [Mucor saturninus]
MTGTILKFTPFNSAVDASFWQALVSKKLDVLKLSEEQQSVHGEYTLGQSVLNDQHETVVLPSRFSIPANGLEVKGEGTLVLTNTIEEFRTIDKNALFQQVTEKIKKGVDSGEAVTNPHVLSSFLLVTFADLKKYKFYYWFAFPAIMPQPDPWTSQPISNCPILEHVEWPFFLLKETAGEMVVTQLCDFNEFFKDIDPDNRIVGFVDPSSTDTPGWPLRNLLYLLNNAFHVTKIKILSYRKQNSLLFQVSLPAGSSYQEVKSVGWERNVQGKLGPRMVDLGPLMDPTRLADTSVDLNLKLMRWRLMPDLDLEKIKQTKCLLLGAGTLGCYVARCLIGWGVRHISFVDNGKVSFSNPVRQPLYQFEDCLHGGSPKAETAAQNLKLVQPTITSVGYNLSIPMPGHPSTSDEKLAKDIESLSSLIESHDVIFLLTDSRESRWFPTLLSAKYNKMVINSALGFDTYLVMRHGTSVNGLGCYFCNDIVAPNDSLTDRTLDQQCTVTRPGLAAIAAALSVELMVSLLQHAEGINAKADTTNNSTILGLLPHQIRGFLGQFSNMLIAGQSYDRCTACSDKIRIAYDKDSLSFMTQALKDPLYLEELTGLAAMKAESEALLLQTDWAEDEDEDDEGLLI